MASKMSTSSARGGIRSNPSRSRNPRNLSGKSPFAGIGSYIVEKNRKLRHQFDSDASAAAASSPGNGIFSGVSIFVDGFTVPPSQELKLCMLRNGGRFQNYFSRRSVTHIICSNLPDSKMKNFRAFSRGLPVIKPTWVMDCVAANKLLSWVPYQLDKLESQTCKQQKLSSFFALKKISTLNADGYQHGSQSNVLFCNDEKSNSLLLNEGDCSKSKQTQADAFQSEDDTEQVCILLDEQQNMIEENDITTACERDQKLKEPVDILHLEPTNQQELMTASTHNSHRDCIRGFTENDIHQIQLFQESNNFHFSTDADEGQDIMPISVSQVDFSVLSELPQELKDDILKSLPAHRALNLQSGAPSNPVKNVLDNAENKNHEGFRMDLWKGTPPNWVEKFATSSCCLLNAIAILYSRPATNNLLSVVLQSLTSFLPTFPKLDNDETEDAFSNLYELLRQYIELKVEVDLEEIFICFRLLRRYATLSKFLLSVYNQLLPFLQTTVSENYGGTFQLSIIEE